MAESIGANRNFNDTAITTQVSVGSTTAVVLVAANEDRIGLTVSNNNNQDVWVRFYDAATDNLKKGILIPSKTSKDVLKNANIYRGEVSVIMQIGGTVTISPTEY